MSGTEIERAIVMFPKPLRPPEPPRPPPPLPPEPDGALRSGLPWLGVVTCAPAPCSRAEAMACGERPDAASVTAVPAALSEERREALPPATVAPLGERR